MWRLLAPASGQQVRKDDDYQNTSRQPWTSRTGVFLAHKAHSYRMGRGVDGHGGGGHVCERGTLLLPLPMR